MHKAHAQRLSTVCCDEAMSFHRGDIINHRKRLKYRVNLNLCVYNMFTVIFKINLMETFRIVFSLDILLFIYYFRDRIFRYSH